MYIEELVYPVQIVKPFSAVVMWGNINRIDLNWLWTWCTVDIYPESYPKWGEGQPHSSCLKLANQRQSRAVSRTFKNLIAQFSANYGWIACGTFPTSRQWPKRYIVHTHLKVIGRLSCNFMSTLLQKNPLYYKSLVTPSNSVLPYSR